MQFRRLCHIWLAAVLGVLGVALPALMAQTEAAPEPTYTARFADKRLARLQLDVTTTTDGQKQVRISNRQGVSSDLRWETELRADSTNVPLRIHVVMGKMPTVAEPAPYTTDLEALRVTLDSWGIRSAPLSGQTRYAGTIVTTPISLMFLGRLYDFKRGGPQTFIMFPDFVSATPQAFNFTLTYDSKETIELEEGKVSAWKMRYSAPDATHLAKRDKEGVLYIGAVGELLRCDTRLFNNPIKLRGPAVREADGSFLMTFDNGRNIFLKAKPAGNSWDMTFGIGERVYPLATGKLDSQFRVLQTESGGAGRGGNSLKAVYGPDTIRWERGAGVANNIAVPDGKIWLSPYWIATDLWEENGEFSLSVDGEQTGTYLPLYTGQRDGTPISIKRLRDRGRLDDSGATVRHYLVTGRVNYHLFTDGARLLYLVGSDSTTIVRDGYEQWASKQPLPPKPVKEGTPPTPTRDANPRRRGR